MIMEKLFIFYLSIQEYFLVLNLDLEKRVKYEMVRM